MSRQFDKMLNKFMKESNKNNRAIRKRNKQKLDNRKTINKKQKSDDTNAD